MWPPAASRCGAIASRIGTIVVTRPAARPFGPEALERLALLTPVVGTAFEAAGELADAVTASEVDQLTQLRNRRRLDTDLAAVPVAGSTAFAMLDVDHFKHFNDANGHGAGDLALRMVADAIAATLRPSDAAYRYGGEEFSVLLHDCGADEAVRVLERVRLAVAALAVPGGDTQPLGRVTVSIGVATTAAGGTEGLQHRADAALYRAKETGRDRTVLADSDLPATV